MVWSSSVSPVEEKGEEGEEEHGEEGDEEERQHGFIIQLGNVVVHWRRGKA